MSFLNDSLPEIQLFQEEKSLNIKKKTSLLDFSKIDIINENEKSSRLLPSRLISKISLPEINIQKEESNELQFPEIPEKKNEILLENNSPTENIISVSSDISNVQPKKLENNYIFIDNINNSLIYSINQFKRLFLNEFKSLIYPISLSPISIVLDDYINSINSEINKILFVPSNESLFLPISVSMSVESLIDDNLKSIKTLLSENQIKNEFEQQKNFKFINEIQSKLKDLNTFFQKNTSSIIRELEYEKHDCLILKNSEYSRIRDLEKRLKNLNLKKLEIESKIEQNKNEFFEIETKQKIINQQFNHLNDEFEDKNNNIELINNFLIELKNIKEEINNPIFNEINKNIKISNKKFKEELNELQKEYSNYHLFNQNIKSNKDENIKDNNNIIKNSKKILKKMKKINK